MCLSPIQIPNNSRFFQKGVSSLFMDVPCGKCLECELQKQRDWLVRLYYEYKYNLSLGGVSYFLTNTYNEDEIPKLNIQDKEVKLLQDWLLNLRDMPDKQDLFDSFEEKYNVSPEYYIPYLEYCFSRKDLQKMIKSLRQILHQEGILDYSDKRTIRVFVVTEYGEDRHRPHYHIIFFLPIFIEAQQFKRYVERAWSRKMSPDEITPAMLAVGKLLKKGRNTVMSSHKGWTDIHISKNKYGRVYYNRQYGKISYSDKWTPDIKSPEGIAYVCKYVSKKDRFVSSTEFRVLKDYLKFFPSVKFLRSAGHDDLADVILTLRDCFPFVHCSNFIGISILAEFDGKSDDEIAEMLNINPIELPHMTKKFAIPAYIANRVMYRIDDFDNTLRLLTPIGYETLKFRFNMKVEDIERKLREAFFEKFHTLELSDKQAINKKFNLDVNVVKSYLNTTLFRNFTLTDVAIYSILYRNVQCPPDLLRSLDIQTVRDSSLDLFVAKNSQQFNNEPAPNTYGFKALTFARRNTFNYCDCFKDFDAIFEVGREIHAILRKRNMLQSYYDDLDVSRTREAFQQILHR